MKRTFFFLSVLCLALAIVATPCFAGQYDLKTVTADIDQALKGRQARYKQLQALKGMGTIGENNRGYVTCLKEDSVAEAVAAAENADRKTIYRALVEQNGLGANGMYQVEKAFAEVQNEKAFPGEMVQAPTSGDWRRKSAPDRRPASDA